MIDVVAVSRFARRLLKKKRCDDGRSFESNTFGGRSLTISRIGS